MMATEEVEIEINLSSTWWNNPPRCKVWLNHDVLLQSSEIREPTKIAWKGNLAEGEHEIKIALIGKNGITDTISNDAGEITKDQLLNIGSIFIDDINLGQLVYKNGIFATTDGDLNPEMINLGVNGTWSIKFQVPVYIWLLENL